MFSISSTFLIRNSWMRFASAVAPGTASDPPGKNQTAPELWKDTFVEVILWINYQDSRSSFIFLFQICNINIRYLILMKLFLFTGGCHLPTKQTIQSFASVNAECIVLLTSAANASLAISISYASKFLIHIVGEMKIALLSRMRLWTSLIQQLTQTSVFSIFAAIPNPNYR